CVRWVWSRCLYNSGHKSENWGLASIEEFEPVPRLCRYILSVYEDDIRNPIWAPPVLAIRGLNLGSQSDYAVLLDNKLGQTAFDGGYVHNGLLKAARWVFDTEHDVLRELLARNPSWDDFLPRTTAALEDVYNLPCLLCVTCLKDTCMFEEQLFKDPRRLYAPGRLYHIVERKPWSIGRLPPVVRTAVPVDGRLEDIILSCNATQDHAIIWILRESQKALDLMLERDKTMEVPANQRMEREYTLSRVHSLEHQAALERAAALKVPSRSTHSYGTFDQAEISNPVSGSPGEASSFSSSRKRGERWDELIKRIFYTNEFGNMVLKNTQTTKA
ncbi:hypothetical protein AKJ16_DCAP02594, partial [Drosera capensis]